MLLYCHLQGRDIFSQHALGTSRRSQKSCWYFSDMTFSGATWRWRDSALRFVVVLLYQTCAYCHQLLSISILKWSYSAHTQMCFFFQKRSLSLLIFLAKWSMHVFSFLSRTRMIIAYYSIRIKSMLIFIKSIFYLCHAVTLMQCPHMTSCPQEPSLDRCNAHTWPITHRRLPSKDGIWFNQW